uniref:Putative colicin V production protein n=1 Tax=viral metagenome TaxID=1070528 RepID=A0A6M3KPH6_9ZZZZ
MSLAIALSLAQMTGLSRKVGEWIGGSKGAEVADKVLDIAQAVSGAKSPSEALQAISSDKGKLLDFEERLFERQDLLEKLAAGDLKDARKMQTAALQQTDIFSKRFIYYFASFWSVFACLYVGGITFTEIPQENVRFADTVLGFLLGTVVASLIAFFYGSSFGQTRQSELADHSLTNRGS